MTELTWKDAHDRLDNRLIEALHMSNVPCPVCALRFVVDGQTLTRVATEPESDVGTADFICPHCMFSIRVVVAGLPRQALDEKELLFYETALTARGF